MEIKKSSPCRSRPITFSAFPLTLIEFQFRQKCHPDIGVLRGPSLKNRHWLFIATILSSIFLFSACSLVTVKFPGEPLPTEELNIRIATRDFAKHFTKSVEETAETIIVEAQDPTIEANALRWKLNATAEVQNAVFQPIPSVALIDTWSLCIQMASFFNAGNGRTLFGDWQPSVNQTANRLLNSIESLVQSTVPKEKFVRYQQFVTSSARAMPITSLSFFRESMLSQWAQFEGKNEKELMKTVGTTPEVLEDFISKFAFYEITIPKRVQWSTRLYMLESGMAARIDRQMAALNASSKALVTSTQQAATSFTRIEHKMTELADESPDLIDTAMARISTNLAPAMEKLNINWGATIELMDKINLRWDATLGVLSAERQALVEDLQKERSAIALEADRMIERSLMNLKRTITQWIIFGGIFAFLILGLSFTMGFLVGKTYRQQT